VFTQSSLGFSLKSLVVITHFVHDWPMTTLLWILSRNDDNTSICLYDW
jgi:hypothetical protein